MKNTKCRQEFIRLILAILGLLTVALMASFAGISQSSRPLKLSIAVLHPNQTHFLHVFHTHLNQQAILQFAADPKIF